MAALHCQGLQAREDPTILAKLLMEFVMAVDERQAPVAALGVEHLLPAVIRYFTPQHLWENTGAIISCRISSNPCFVAQGLTTDRGAEAAAVPVNAALPGVRDPWPVRSIEHSVDGLFMALRSSCTFTGGAHLHPKSQPNGTLHDASRSLHYTEVSRLSGEQSNVCIASSCRKSGLVLARRC